MNAYVKSALIGTGIYLAVHVAYCFSLRGEAGGGLWEQVDMLTTCALFGPFLWLPWLLYPAGLMFLAFGIEGARKRPLHPSFIAWTVAAYGVCLVAAQGFFELFEMGDEVSGFLLVSAISCAVGYVVSRTRTTPDAG